MQQRVYKQYTVKRIDECVREQEARDHDEMIAKARRASAKAKRATALASSLLAEIGYLL